MILAAAKFSWKKLGLLYGPNLRKIAASEKLKTHFSNPVAVPISGDTFRIYFSGRDEKKRSSVGAVDVDLSNLAIVKEYADPFFMHGPPGSFFADGVSIGCVYRVGESNFMLFMAWQNDPGKHWRGDIGQLRVDEDGGLSLSKESPTLGIGSFDKLSLSYPWVEQLKSGAFRMWYGSTMKWDAGNGEMLHVLNVADSIDGQSWENMRLSVPYVVGKAQAFSRPTVLRLPNDEWAMWFSFRGDAQMKYRIGLALSSDGQTWRLANENSGISVSASGWDSEMVEYPFVFKHKGETFMLYNGNGYGQTGFGLAKLELSND
jgi:hypothetical protein